MKKAKGTELQFPPLLKVVKMSFAELCIGVRYTSGIRRPKNPRLKIGVRSQQIFLT
jgi:hypothetical protein